jgi:plastocyanin
MWYNMPLRLLTVVVVSLMSISLAQASSPPPTIQVDVVTAVSPNSAAINDTITARFQVRLFKPVGGTEELPGNGIPSGTSYSWTVDQVTLDGSAIATTGVTLTPDTSDNRYCNMSASFANPGNYTIRVKATVSNSNWTSNPSATQTVSVTVVKIDKLQYQDATNTYVDVSGTLYVPVGASLSFQALPDHSGASWPSGKPVWGGTSGASGTGATKTVTFSTSGSYTVTAQCGNTVTANVTVVQVDTIQYQDATSGYIAVPNPLKVKAGSTVNFKAISAPTGATWPGGKPVWGGTSGASGTGDTTSVTFNTPGNFTVTAECGNTVTVNVLVYTITMDVRRMGTTTYAGSAIVVAGALGTSIHKADVRLTAIDGSGNGVSGIQVNAPSGGAPFVLTHSDITPANLTTGTDGTAVFTYTSSDQVTTATPAILTYDSLSVSIDQRWDDITDDSDWTSDPYFYFEESSPITFAPKFNGPTPEPLTFHTVDFLTTQVYVWEWDDIAQVYNLVGYTIDPASANPTANPPIYYVSSLSDYADYSPTSYTDTGSSGSYPSAITVHWDIDNIVDTIWFGAQDQNVYK